MCQAQLLDEIRLVGIEAGNARAAENAVRIYREIQESYQCEGRRRSGEEPAQILAFRGHVPG